MAPAAHHTLPERIYYPAPVGVDALLLPAALLPVASSPRQTGLEGPKSTLAASVRLIHCRSPVGLAVHRHSVHRQQCGSSSDRPASPAPDKTRRSADLHAARTAPVIHQCATYGPIDGPKRREARGGEPRSINDQRPVIPAVRARCRDGATSARTNTSISPILTRTPGGRPPRRARRSTRRWIERALVSVILLPIGRARGLLIIGPHHKALPRIDLRAGTEISSYRLASPRPGHTQNFSCSSPEISLIRHPGWDSAVASTGIIQKYRRMTSLIATGTPRCHPDCKT